MSTIREVLFKVERDNTAMGESVVLYASTSFESAQRKAALIAQTTNEAIVIISYADSDHFDFGFGWLGDIAPCLVWRTVYDWQTGMSWETNMTYAEQCHADAMAEWRDECAAAAS